jgi:flagellar hook-associated protein FlgK
MVKDADNVQAGSSTTQIVIPNTKVFTDAELAGRMVEINGETRVIQSYDPATFTITLDAPPLAADPTGTAYRIFDPTPTWSSDNSGLTFGRGAISGLVEARQYIVDNMHDLHLFSIDFASIVNSVQRTTTFPPGADVPYDLDGNAVPSPPDPGWEDYTIFFADTPGQMSVGITDVRKIAASLSATETGNGLNMVNLWEAIHANQTLTDTTVLNNNSLANFSNTFSGNLAVDVQVATEQTNTTQTTRDMFQNAVWEYSAVNMDEEMTDMLSVQKAFQAAAKLIGVLDSMMATVIGMV